MKLEVNHQIVSENATKNDITKAIHDLLPDDEAIIILSESDDIFLQAGGIPQSGLIMSYINSLKGDDLQSKNHALNPQTIERVFKHYLDGNIKWRQTIAWQKTADIKTPSGETPQVSRKTKGLLLGCFLYLTFLFPLFAIVLDTVIKETIFIPMCAQHGVAVVSYAHSGGGIIQGTFQNPRCTFANGTAIDLSDIVGWNVIWLDSVMQMLVALLPFTIPTLIGLFFVRQFYRQKKQGELELNAKPSESRKIDTSRP